jgi:hypothetical protein
MARRWLAGLAVALLLLGSSGVSADPSNWAQLGQIILWLQQIDQTLKDLNVVVDDIRGNLAQVYPEAGLRHIETLFEPVDSIKEEVEKLAFRVLIGPLKFAQRTKADRARLALLTSRSGSQLLEVVPQIFDEAAALLVPTPAVGVLSVW